MKEIAISVVFALLVWGCWTALYIAIDGAGSKLQGREATISGAVLLD